MANRSDLKLAIFSILITMGSEADLSRVFALALHLNRQRHRERANQLALSFERDDS